MVWSFSRLNSYYHCPYEWKLKYLYGMYGIGSAMAQHGGFVHKIHELYFKGQLDLFDLPIYYEDHYAENVTLPFPGNKYVDLADKYYQQGLEYFENFDWDLSGYEILGVEKEVQFTYQGYQFVGFIDLLLRDKKDGKLIILDHKSSALKILKSGKISKTGQEHFEEFKKQLYLYSHAVIAEYGKGSVKSLKWNLFRVGTFYEIPWKKEEYEESMKWAVDTIHLIESDTEWNEVADMTVATIDSKCPPFYCMNLCSQRETCPYKIKCLTAFRSLNNAEEYTDGFEA